MEKCDCPIQTVAKIIGSKWVVLILRDLFLGKTRFNEFLESNPQLHNKVLSAKLREMSNYGLIKRTKCKKSLEIHYELTPFGQSFKPVFMELANIGKEFCQKETDFMQFISKMNA